MLIGILGHISAGKGVVSDNLVQNHNFKKDSFAHSLKDSCSVIFDWPRELLEGDTVESRNWREEIDPWWATKLNIDNFSPRLALQLIGTDALRNHFHPDIWLLSLENRLRQNPTNNVVIADARFPNEIEMIRRVGGKLIRVDRGEEPSWVRVATLANTGDKRAISIMETLYAGVHRSEWAWAGTKPDIIINNNGTLLDLDKQLSNLSF